MKPALLVIDVQKAFFKNPETTQSLNQAIAQINMGIELFREKRLPILFAKFTTLFKISERFA